MFLERELCCQVNPARPATPQERVADAHVAGGGQGQKAEVMPDGTRSRIGIRRSRIRDKPGEDGI